MYLNIAAITEDCDTNMDDHLINDSAIIKHCSSSDLLFIPKQTPFDLFENKKGEGREVNQVSIYMTESVKEYVVQKYKEFDGKTLVSFIEEGFELSKDEEERKDKQEHKMEQMKKPPHLLFDNFNI